MPASIFNHNEILRSYFTSPLIPNDINKARFRVFRQKYHPSLGRSAGGGGTRSTGLGRRNPGMYGAARHRLGAVQRTVIPEESIDTYGGLVTLIFISFVCVSNLEAAMKALAVRVNRNKRDYAALQKYMPALDRAIKSLATDRAQHKQDTDIRTLGTLAWDTNNKNRVPTPNTPTDDASYVVCTDDVSDVGRLLVKLNLSVNGKAKRTSSSSLTYDLGDLRDMSNNNSPTLETLVAIQDDVTKKSIYLSTLSTQEAQEIQAATSIYQVNIQYCSALVSLLKTIGGAIVQRF